MQKRERVAKKLFRKYEMSKYKKGSISQLINMVRISLDRYPDDV